MTPPPDPLVWLAVAVGAWAAAATLTIWLAPVLRRNGAVVRPGPDGLGRAVPRGAGLAIVGVTAAAAGAAAWFAPELRLPILAWLGPALGVAAVSLRDDFRPLPAALRLAVHVAAAVAAVALLGAIDEVAIAGRSWPLAAAAWPLTLLWVVGLTNAFNFMDGIDGIAGLTAMVAGAALAAAAAAAGCGPVAIVAVAFAAAAAGFLSGNWPPAKVFMGDVGSTFCGFTLAALPLAVPAAARAALVPVAVLAMWPFVFDAATTLVERIGRRENLFQTHRGHIYQRLVLAGWSHRTVTILYGVLAAIGGGVAVMAVVMQRRPLGASVAVGAFLVAVPAVLVACVHTSPRREPGDCGLPTVPSNYADRVWRENTPNQLHS
jgi:UDP-N-acetylmuramyl pentapeptide phosphotransferase/UDP-N-acetylglucosamine-1-phosphate transferase